VLRAAALLFIFLLFSSGCRNTEDSQTSDALPTLHFVFKVSDRFSFDGWRLNQYGIHIDSTQARHVQRVISTQQAVGGAADAIVIVDSVTTVRTGAAAEDTLVYRLTPEGGIAQYGFLSALVRRREGRVIQKNWDMLYAPASAGWLVGRVDAAGVDRVYATMNSPPDYFQVVSGGQALVFPAYRVRMTGSTLDLNLWMTDSPTCFPRFEEYPEPYADILSGSLLILTEKVPAP
jgi:hypothetical protein